MNQGHRTPSSAQLPPSIRTNGRRWSLPQGRIVCSAEILYEDDQVIAILDINPIHYGHALVIPKTHCADFLSLPELELPAVMRACQRVAQAMVKSLDLKGFNLFSNNGRVAGQSVSHFHMHITPRYPDDNIRFLHSLKSYRNGSMAEYARRIREHIPS